MALPEWFSDTYLLSKIRRGDRHAFTALYDQHVKRLFTMLHRLTGSIEIAEDLTQETFVAAFRSLASYQGRSSFGTWLHGIALHTYRNHRRYAQTRPETESMVDEDSLGISTEGDPLATCTRREAEDAMERAILNLPTAAREAFVLVRVEGMAYQQAADQLDIPLGTLQSRLHRATQQLYRTLSHLIYEGDALPPFQAAKGSKHVIR